MTSPHAYRLDRIANDLQLPAPASRRRITTVLRAEALAAATARVLRAADSSCPARAARAAAEGESFLQIARRPAL